MRSVHVVVPGGIDDPARVSGGNRYDRAVCDHLRAAGWAVAEIVVDGTWPRPDDRALAALAGALDALPRGSAVLVDGLVASAASAVLVPRSGRLRLVVLVHMLFGGGVPDGSAVPEREESAVLAAARAVVTTSDWTRCRLLDRYRLPAARVHVARPGSDRAPVARPSPDGGRLLCVGTVSPLKGQDVLVAALSRLAALSWRCTLVGPLDRDPRFVAALQDRAAAPGLAGRIRILGTRTGDALRHEYADADLLVVPSRAETYGMVVTEALAVGLPLAATAVGGIPEAVGRTGSGVPALLVPPDSPAALASALAGWLTDADLRSRLRGAALARRETLADWARTGESVRRVLGAVVDEPDPSGIRVPR